MTAPANNAAQPAASTRERRDARGARWRWAGGLAVGLGFHVGLVALTRVAIDPQHRTDPINPRISWVGDKAELQEDTVLGQLLRELDDTPLFMITSQNFAGNRPRSAETGRPGEIFASYDPILTVPVDRSPRGLVVAPMDQVDPVVAIQEFRWPYFSRYGRADPVVRTFEARRARLEVRSMESGALVLAESLPPANDRETPEVWPDWRWFELQVSVSEARRLSEPSLIGGGSGSDRVDQFIRDHIRRRMRLDLRLEPGNYRILVGP